MQTGMMTLKRSWKPWRMGALEEASVMLGLTTSVSYACGCGKAVSTLSYVNDLLLHRNAKQGVLLGGNSSVVLWHLDWDAENLQSYLAALAQFKGWLTVRLVSP